MNSSVLYGSEVRSEFDLRYGELQIQHTRLCWGIAKFLRARHQAPSKFANRTPAVGRLGLAGASIVIAAALHAAPARAQVGVSLSADSDHRFRGVSLSDGRPVVSLSLSYDHDSG